MSKLPRTGFDFVITVSLIVASVFGVISIFNYITAVVLFYVRLGPPEITLTDIANVSGLLAGFFAITYVILALIQEWRLRRGRNRD